MALGVMAFAVFLAGCRSVHEADLPESSATIEQSSVAVAAPEAEKPFVPRPLFEDIPSSQPAPYDDAPVPATWKEGDGPIRISRVDPDGPPDSGDREETRSRVVDEPPLLELVRALLVELREFEGTKESDLVLGDRLRKYKTQTKIIALHYLLPPDHEHLYLDSLLRSLENPADPPSKAHALMVASFYQDIDREELRDQTLARIVTSGPTSRSLAKPSDFSVENLRLCKDVDGYRNFTPVTQRSLKAGKELVIYGELENLQNEHDADAGAYRTGVEATVHVFDDDGEEVRRIPLTAPGGESRPHPERIDRDIFMFPFRVPEGLDGRHRFVVRVRDLYSGLEDDAELSYRVRK